MRGSDPGGRFTIPSEIDRYKNGINEDLRDPAGTQVPWWRYDKAGTKVDDVYDIGIGRHWRGPYTMPVISAHLTQGATFQSDRGFYNADVLRLLINMRDLHRVFPSAVATVDDFLRDRVQFNGKTFRPSSAQLDGLVLDRWTIFKVDLIEVKEEEQYNDYDLGSRPNADDPYDSSDPNPTADDDVPFGLPFWLPGGEAPDTEQLPLRLPVELDDIYS